MGPLCYTNYTMLHNQITGVSSNKFSLMITSLFTFCEHFSVRRSRLSDRRAPLNRWRKKCKFKKKRSLDRRTADLRGSTFAFRSTDAFRFKGALRSANSAQLFNKQKYASLIHQQKAAQSGVTLAIHLVL